MQIRVPDDLEVVVPYEAVVYRACIARNHDHGDRVLQPVGPGGADSFLRDPRAGAAWDWLLPMVGHFGFDAKVNHRKGTRDSPPEQQDRGTEKLSLKLGSNKSIVGPS